ncbi:MAG: adenosylcobinamide-phosphate synthase CbiB [Paracoccaceae bacterium]|nr:adenosylcobinamide-phosphate synthase CbiB [Paracoccaceae bacterium]
MLALGLILDALIGEPDEIWRRAPHPVVLFGKLTEFLEKVLNQGLFRKARGALAMAALCLAAAIPAWILSLDIFFGVLEVAALAVLLAHRGLIDYVKAVADGLRVSLEEGRYAVARIVGRDPATLDEAGVARAAIESAAENFSDAVVAPVFWYLVAGLPGIAVYKMINTADSMIGHKNDRYEEFGWAAARLDDVANWIPARLTGFVFCLVGDGRVAMDVMLRDAPRHRSVNAGWPEAAMAASLGVALAGPRVYEGERVDGPFLNAEAREDARPDDIEGAIRLAWLAWAVVLAIALLAALFGR